MPEEIKKPEYKYAGKETLSQITRSAIPKQFMPTGKLVIIFGVILLLVAILAIAQFPIGKLISGDLNIILKVGYPLTLLEIGIANSSTTFQLGNLLLDLLIYLALSYIVNIFINIVTSIGPIGPKKEQEKPKAYNIPKASLADKVTKEVFKEES